MFSNSSKLHVVRGFVLPVTRQPQHRRNTGVISVSSAYVEPSFVQQSSGFIQSSVVPAEISQLHTRPPVFTVDPPLAYDVLQGSLVRHCDVSSTAPPTIVFIHGIMGSKKNLQAFAKRVLEGHPSWQAILVDLPCHGDSSCPVSLQGTHSVESAARDILQLLNYLKVFPRVLVGHSFGGKVVLSMAHQFGQTLPRPVHAWVLDTLPGEVSFEGSDDQDQPFDLIKTLQNIPLPLPSRSSLIHYLSSKGFSIAIANWMTTNLRQMSHQKFIWTFDLEGIEKLYKSYERTSFWPLLYAPPEGLKIDFVRAEKSHFRWTDQLQQQIEDSGHRVHLLGNAGHWVHADNPDGLYHIIKQSLGQEFTVRQPSFV